MSLWISRGQEGIPEGFRPKSCGQAGERQMALGASNVTDLRKYKLLVVGKKFLKFFYATDNYGHTMTMRNYF